MAEFIPLMGAPNERPLFVSGINHLTLAEMFGGSLLIRAHGGAVTIPPTQRAALADKLAEIDAQRRPSVTRPDQYVPHRVSDDLDVCEVEDAAVVILHGAEMPRRSVSLECGDVARVVRALRRSRAMEEMER